MINGKKIVATIEARMTSTRLPGKVMLPFVGKPGLQVMIERLNRSQLVDQIVVATTVNLEDQLIVKLCQRLGIAFYRGSEEDVLKRLVEAGQSVSADIIIETTSDCPVIDWRHVDHLVNLFFSGNYDYVSNIVTRSFPIGFDVQVFPLSILEQIEKLTKEHTYREHPTFYIYTHPQKFRLKNCQAQGQMYWPDLRVTLDTPQDYKVLTQVFNHLYSKNPDFSAEDVVNLLKSHPEIVAINSAVKQKNPHQELKHDQAI